MTAVLHVVVTGNLAGAERYVATVASETAARGHRVAVVGGCPRRMPAALGPGVEWRPGASILAAARSVAALGRFDVCHVHMTLAEAVGVALRPLHRGLVVSTRHFAARRGSTTAGRLLAPLIERGLHTEIAISRFVAERSGVDAVVPNGVPEPAATWTPGSRTVLMLQRLEREKDTLAGLEAFSRSGLAAEGWRLRVVGEGAQRAELERLALPGVEFAGWVSDVPAELSAADVLLATAPAEPLGLSVLEAMAAGVPVLAAAGGGHVETVGLTAPDALFTPGDRLAAAALLRRAATDPGWLTSLSARARATHAHHFTLTTHVDRLLTTYPAA